MKQVIANININTIITSLVLGVVVYLAHTVIETHDVSIKIGTKLDGIIDWQKDMAAWKEEMDSKSPNWVTLETLNQKLYGRRGAVTN
jgi:hypothetical protein